MHGGTSPMKRKIAAILAADVAGYSRLVAEAEEETLTRLGAFRQVFDEFVKRSGGRPFEPAAGYTYEAIHVVADALERAGNAAPEAVTEALRRTSLAPPLMVASGPISFDAAGDNPNAVPALLQIAGGRPLVVWPRDAAERPYALAGAGER